MERVFSLNEVARRLAIPSYKIAYGISSGALPEPKTRFTNKRVFTNEDVERIAKHFGVEYSTPAQKQEETP